MDYFNKNELDFIFGLIALHISKLIDDNKENEKLMSFFPSTETYKNLYGKNIEEIAYCKELNKKIYDLLYVSPLSSEVDSEKSRCDE